MKFFNNYCFLLTDYSMFGTFSIKCHSKNSFPFELVLRVLEAPGSSVNIKMTKSNLSITIGPFETKDYI